jgi:hypothetical protein
LGGGPIGASPRTGKTQYGLSQTADAEKVPKQLVQNFEVRGPNLTGLLNQGATASDHRALWDFGRSLASSALLLSRGGLGTGRFAFNCRGNGACV